LINIVKRIVAKYFFIDLNFAVSDIIAASGPGFTELGGGSEEVPGRIIFLKLQNKNAFRKPDLKIKPGIKPNDRLLLRKRLL